MKTPDITQGAAVPYEAKVLQKGQIISTIEVHARNEFEAWSLACTTYLNDYVQADQASVDIRINEKIQTQ